MRRVADQNDSRFKAQDHSSEPALQGSELESQPRGKSILYQQLFASLADGSGAPARRCEFLRDWRH